MGLLSLAGKHRAEQIEAGCELALSHRAFHLKDVRALIGEPSGGKPHIGSDPIAPADGVR